MRRDGPFSTIRWQLERIRSQIASATVGSPIWSCQSSGERWLVRTVERSPYRPSIHSDTSRRSVGPSWAMPQSSRSRTSTRARAARVAGPARLRQRRPGPPTPRPAQRSAPMPSTRGLLAAHRVRGSVLGRHSDLPNGGRRVAHLRTTTANPTHPTSTPRLRNTTKSSTRVDDTRQRSGRSTCLQVHRRARGACRRCAASCVSTGSPRGGVTPEGFGHSRESRSWVNS